MQAIIHATPIHQIMFDLHLPLAIYTHAHATYMYCHSTKIKSNLLCTVTAGGVGDFYIIVAEAEATRAGLMACVEVETHAKAVIDI